MNNQEDKQLEACTGPYLTFALGREQYGIELLKVREIKGYIPVTPIPNTPSHIKGVINLRGSVIPIIDMRARFSMATIEYSKFNVIIVVTVGDKVLGLLVDAVSDVLEVGPQEIRPVPELGAGRATQFMSGMAQCGEKLAVLLDIESLLAEENETVLASAISSHSEQGTPPSVNNENCGLQTNG